MKNNLIDGNGISGITEQDEHKGDLDNYTDILSTGNWFEDVVRKQLKADYTCPKCGIKSSMVGDCSSCGFKWIPPLFA